MNKKLMAVAVAGALAAPGLALAQASTVSVSGSLNVEYGFVSQADGETAAGLAYGRPNADAFNSGASNIKFSGEEKLGGGMSAWFACESRLRFGQDVSDSQGQDGFCGRNSALGLKGSFGNVFFGRWDSPLNLAQDAGRGGLLQTAGWTGVEKFLLADEGKAAGHPGFDLARRNANSVNYVTPSFGGLTGSFQYTTTNDAISNASVATLVAKKGRAISASAYYSSGPLEAALGYTKHDDNQSDTSAAAFDGAKDKAWLLGASYVFGAFKVGLLYTDIDGHPTATTDVERKSWALGAAWKITGTGTVRFGYVKVGDFKGSAVAAADADNGAKAWQVGYSHALSKRTTASIYHHRVNNDRMGIYNFAGMTAAGVVFPGSDPRVVSLQLQHKF